MSLPTELVTPFARLFNVFGKLFYELLTEEGFFFLFLHLVDCYVIELQEISLSWAMLHIASHFMKNLKQWSEKHSEKQFSSKRSANSKQHVLKIGGRGIVKEIWRHHMNALAAQVDNTWTWSDGAWS